MLLTYAGEVSYRLGVESTGVGEARRGHLKAKIVSKQGEIVSRKTAGRAGKGELEWMRK